MFKDKKKLLFTVLFLLLVSLNIYQAMLLLDASITCTYSEASINGLKYKEHTADILLQELLSGIDANKFEAITLKLKNKDSKLADIHKETSQIVVGPYVFDKTGNHYQLKPE